MAYAAIHYLYRTRRGARRELAALRRELREEVGLAVGSDPPHVWHQRVAAPGHAAGYEASASLMRQVADLLDATVDYPDEAPAPQVTAPAPADDTSASAERD